ncbi:MAG: hypothetical protein K6C14_07540 [Eubacterium sp.]|nr:hypothetical protein [Eubacterium sp.]
MELNDIFSAIIRNLTPTNERLGFKLKERSDDAVIFSGDKGVYRLIHDSESNILSFECAYGDDGGETEFNTISRLLVDPDDTDEREARSVSNDLNDEIENLFKVKKQVNLDKVKMPKAVAKSKAKSGIISYDVDTLANRFGALYPEYKDIIKQMIVDYGEFLPETFFREYGNEKIFGIIKNGTEQEQKKLFKLLGEIFEDGTNEVQDVIAVTILGEMKNDPDMMAVADRYMTEYMAGPVHEVNKVTAKKNKYTKKLENPPAYKPKKRKSFSLTNALNNPQNQN